MYGDFTRRTFDAADGYRAVLLQQGRVLLDADVNEQAEIAAHHDEARTRDLVGRHGGPSPDDPTTPGPFAIVAEQGTTWADLRLTPGTYYVDGVLCELPPAADGGPWPLSSQPMTPRTRVYGDDSTALDMLEEPTPEAAVVVYLDVWTRQVTPDEDPSLLEPALGGADTTIRARTTWQIRADDLGTDDAETVQSPSWKLRLPRLMTADIVKPEQTSARAATDTGLGTGYRNLENQLYRVEVHDVEDGTKPPTIVWSRDNGSTVARLLGIQATELTIDRNGRDEVSAIGRDDLVEVTSADWELHGRSGFLATVQGDPAEDPDTGRVVLTVAWIDQRPDLAKLGLVPIVRRWDGMSDFPGDGVALKLADDGISVTFPAAGANQTFAIGDHWLIPARTAQLAFGLGDKPGSIDWPIEDGKRRPMPPAGPEHRYAPLAILRKNGDAWTVEDCRRLFDPLSDPHPPLVLQLLGGDGQSAPPGKPLAQPIRVAVRGGTLKTLTLSATTTGGHLAIGKDPTAGDPSSLILPLDQSRVVEIGWLLDGAGDRTQALTVTLDGAPADEKLVLTGGLDLVDHAPWQPPNGCTGFADVTDVQAAVTRLVQATRLTLLQGGGQRVRSGSEFAALPVWVRLTSECGPAQGAVLTAQPSGNGIAGAAHPGETSPPNPLPAGGTATTDVNGEAGFWWRPGTDAHARLTITSGNDSPPLVVEASSRTGANVTGFAFGSGASFDFDGDVAATDLGSGVVVHLDADVNTGDVDGKPVLHAVLSLPWPFLDDGRRLTAAATPTPIGWRTVELAGTRAAGSQALTWTPSDDCRAWLDNLWAHLSGNGWTAPLQGRFVVDAWSITGLLVPENAAGGTIVHRFTTSPR